MAARKRAEKAARKSASKASRRPAAPKKATARRAALARKAAKPVTKSARSAARAKVSAMAMNGPNGKPVTNGIGLNHHHMDYSTHDPDAMKRFFVEVLGFTNVLYIPEHRYLSVFISPTSSFGFIPPSGVAPEQWQPPGEPNMYFFVDDVDRAFKKLRAKGVSFEQEPADMPWGHRLAILRDPEGRRVCLAQRK
jgi:catechol 2,3-dioxygenase-like lactoylglutathione lyase family enzyme